VKISVMPACGVLLVLSGCSANLRPPELSPVEYLVVRTLAVDNVPVAALREAAIRQATAGCKHNHQAFKLIDGDAGGPPNISFTDREIDIQQLKDADARRYTSVGISFRCAGASAAS